MLKHVVNHHRDMELEEVKFGMRVVSFTRSAMERQDLESVKIQEERSKNNIMNSKSEYSRCTIPRLTAKMGDKEYDKKRDKEKEEEKIMEEAVKLEIKRRKMERCKRRGREIHDHQDSIEDRQTHSQFASLSFVRK